jgi:sphingomyelin phosphodiesterase acid-like 3
MKWCWLLFLLFLWQMSYANESNSLRILSLSDIHFNPFASCSKLEKTCPLINELQKTNARHWAAILQKFAEPQHKRADTNYLLLVSSLKQAKNAAQNHQIQFVVVLGDYLAHEYKRLFKRYSKDTSSSAYRHFVNQTFEFLFHELSITFPNTPIYIAVGNHDTYHSNYALQPKGPFFEEIAHDATLLIPPNQRKNVIQQFQNAGYYSVLLNSKIRLLMLNSVLFSYKAKGEGVSQAAQNQLVWLKKQLDLSVSQNEKIIIGMHIPPVYDFYLTPRIRVATLFHFWRKEYIDQFNQLLEDFSHHIIAMMAAHQHMEQLKYMRFADGSVIPMLTAASISPIFGNDPEFSVYIFSLLDYQLTDNISYNQKLPE